MTVAQTKPAKDAAFFEQLAQLNESMLVNAAMTAAVRKDFDSLNGLVDFLMRRGGEIPVLTDNVEMQACIPRNATDKSIGVEKKGCSIALAFATAMGTRDPEASGRFNGVSPPEALVLAKRVGDLYNMPHADESLKGQLHKVLHMAGGQGVDRSVFQALVAAGANPGEDPCRNDGLKVATLPAVEALLQYHLVSAADLFEMTPPAAVKTFVDNAMKPKAKGGQTEITQFSNAPGMEALINGLRFQGNRVGACLKQIDARMAEGGHPDDASRFRMFLAHAYLKKVASRDCENFGEKQMLALFGEPGDAVNNGLRNVLDAFARQENPNTGKNPELDKWRAASAIAGKTNFELVEADFLYQAVRTHCTDALNISRELMVSAAKGKGPGLNQALDGNMTDRSGTKDQWSFNLDRFKKTMQTLIDAGTDPNALPGGRNALHLLANSKASCVMDMMPAVMALVDKPDGKDGAKQTPLDVLKKTRPVDTEMHGRWESIVKSRAARHSALNLIDEIERDEKERPDPMIVDATFFQTLAEISDHALIHTAHELAKKKNLPDLMVLAEHLAAGGKDIAALKQATRMAIWNPVDDMAGETSLAKAFAIACSEENPETLALMTKVTETGIDRQQLLNSMVIQSTSASMLKIAARGSPREVIGQAIDEAINFSYTHAAMHMARLTDEAMLDFCKKANAMKPHETGSPAHVFVTTMREIDQVVAVGAFLDDADRMMAPLGDEARRAAAGMRMAFVVEWLRYACNYGLQRDTMSLDALIGSHLKDPPASPIAERMIDFAAAICKMKGSISGPDPWEVKSKGSHNEHQSFLEADFYAWAVRSHCAPLLALCSPVATMAINDRDAPGIFLAMQPKDRRTKSAREEPMERVAAKGTGFKETLLALIKAGHSVNAIPEDYAKGGTALHALARMMNKSDISESLGFERLVALLEVGTDPRIQSRGCYLAEEILAEDKRDRWIGVVNAFGSRSAAHAALQELDFDSPSPQKKVSP